MGNQTLIDLFSIIILKTSPTLILIPTYSEDCGIFMLKFIKYMSTDLPFDFGQDINFFRKKYAVDVLHL